MAKNQSFDSRKFTFKNRTKIQKGFNIGSAVEMFLEAKRLEKRSEKTVKTYRQTLVKFCEWYEGNEFEELSPELISDYIRYMTFEKVKWDDHPTNHSKQVGISPRSVNNIIRILRIFFNYLVDQRHITFNPTTGIKYQTERDDTFEVFTDDDIIKLINSPNVKTFTGFRDYVMMLLLIDTGLRIGEMTNLRINDIDTVLRQVTVRAEISKSNRTRIIPITRKTTESLSMLMEYINMEPTDFVFLTSFGERYVADTFAKMLKKYAKSAGVVDVRVSPHSFRHYFAIKYLKSGGDPFSLMKILGHTDISMTQRYVKYALGDIQENHEKASPVSSLFEKSTAKRRGKRRF